MKRIATGLILSAITVQILSAQHDTIEYQHRPFQFTFMFPPLSTNGVQNAKIINNVSLNLFLGVSGGVENFEAGTFVNVDRYYVKGFQLAGFGNTVGGFSRAAQLAGFYNITGSYLTGFQGAGFINIAGSSATGAQLAGFANVAGAVKGLQAAGFLNITGRTDQAVQAAGFGNISGGGESNFQGAGFFNVADSVEGAQLAGFINIAGHVKGVQIAGFLNICDSIEGVPLGFINVVKKNGYRKLTLSLSEIQYLNVAFKMGVRELYNVYSFGKPFGPAGRWMFGAGLGTEFDLSEKMILNIEDVVHQELWFGNPARYYFTYIDRLNLYNSLKFLFGWNMDSRVALQVGPTFNVSVANVEEFAGSMPWHPIPFYSVYNHTSPSRTNVQLWFGLQGSISF
jgi:hypothetical protein